MEQFTPTMGLTGLYTLKPPFDTALISGIAYTCIALRKLSDIIASGGDPQADYYTPASLDATVYAADVAADVCIVSLQAGGYDLVYVPSSYIVGYPDIGGVPYTNMALAISIGSIPESLDLSVVRQKIQDDVLELLGVNAVTHAMAVSIPSLLSYTQAQTIEAARQAKIGTVVTDYSKLLSTQNQLQSAQQRIQELETYIKNNPPAPPPP